MTTIRLHGILKHEFGSSFKARIAKPREAFAVIEANRSNFKKRIIDLHKKGFNYAIVVDGKRISEKSQLELIGHNKVIDIVPLILGLNSKFA